MKHVSNVADLIVKLLPGATHPINGVAFNITCFAVDFAGLCKNIKETSFNEKDRIERCRKLADESGVELFEIKKLTA